MKILASLQLVGTVIVCGASLASMPVAAQEYDPGDSVAPYDPGNPTRVPEIVITGSNPGSGCIVNYCYSGGWPPGTTTPVGLPPTGSSAGPTTTAEWQVFFQKLIKTGQKLCKKKSEDCKTWGQRMVSRSVGMKDSICDVSGTLGSQYV